MSFGQGPGEAGGKIDDLPGRRGAEGRGVISACSRNSPL